jgi:hypothetical protein
MAFLLSLISQVLADDAVDELRHRLFPLFRQAIERRDKIFVDFW